MVFVVGQGSGGQCGTQAGQSGVRIWQKAGMDCFGGGLADACLVAVVVEG
ncbi:hypothetical protein GCM10027447_33180 [Glycomyces halotolerans]